LGSFQPPDSLSERDYIRKHALNFRADMHADKRPLLQKVRMVVPFDDFCISGLDIEGCRVGSGIFLASSLPEPILWEYTERQIVKGDPFTRLITPEGRTAQSQEVSRVKLNHPEARLVEDLSRRYDVAPRTAISLWSGGRLYGAVTVTRIKPFTAEELQLLELFAEPLHQEAAAPVLTMANERLRLTQGEIRCLAFAAEGKSSAEIADDAGYTTETVNFYLKAAMKKLGAANRTQAVVSAIRRGII
jgi:DNA-binding CsgD family transcriptional regulator